MKGAIRGLFLIGVMILSAVLAAEVGATLFYVWQPGKYVSPSARLAALKNMYAQKATPAECQYGDNLIVHPYLAFVTSQFGPCGWKWSNSKSMIGKEYPDKKTPRTGVILVAGGSVAAGFIKDNRHQPSELEKILNAEFTGDRFDRFIVLNGGMGAWKQPQQSILFSLYADVLDGVIMLDGYNEHFMLLESQRFEAPREFFTMVQRTDTRAGLSFIAEATRAMNANLSSFVLRHRIFHVSNLAYFAFDKTREYLRTFAERQSGENWQADSYARMFALQEPMDPDELKAWDLEQYAKYIRLTHAGAKWLGIPDLFLIQPSPAFGKPLTAREVPLATGTRQEIYAEMANHLVGLRMSDGIPVFSLLDVFKDVSEDTYEDMIHLNPLGLRIVSERVADLIESEWGWPRHRAPRAKSR